MERPVRVLAGHHRRCEHPRHRWRADGAGGPFKGTVSTINVDDIDAVIAKVLAHGGEIVDEKQPIRGVGYQSYIEDNAGIIVGLHQADLKAGL